MLDTLGRKIFLDRYARKDTTRATLGVGDLVLVTIGNDKIGKQKEVGVVTAIRGNDIHVRLEDWLTDHVCHIEHVDKAIERHPQEMIDRVVSALCKAETEEDRDLWETHYKSLLDDWKFVPAGRILTGLGVEEKLSLYNCYALPNVPDNRSDIFVWAERMTEIMSRGGGVGMGLSALRPRDAYVRGVNGRSSGAVSWGSLYSFLTGLIEGGGSRRGAIILVLDVWHPDILEFSGVKRNNKEIVNANLSVGITDKFMQAVKQDAMWDLIFPDTKTESYNFLWDGDIEKWLSRGLPVITYKTIPARELWKKICEDAWACGEPGLWFRDRANHMSNSWYYSPLVGVNPCAEQALPGYGVCNLGSFNLTRYLKKDTGECVLDWDSLAEDIYLAVRLLDNVIDLNHYFSYWIKDQQTKERRIGLGTMGLGELLIHLKLRYGSDECIAFVDKLYKFIAHKAYAASVLLAQERGPFPKFDAEKYLQSNFVRKLDQQLKDDIATYGIRNVTLLTIPPTGTTATMVGTSTGIEPFFAWSYLRATRMGTSPVMVPVYARHIAAYPGKKLPDYMVTAMDISPEEHVKVLAAAQNWVDASISKTSNLPSHYTVGDVQKVYELMYDMGCKGGTVYRDKSRDVQVLERAVSQCDLNGGGCDK